MEIWKCIFSHSHTSRPSQINWISKQVYISGSFDGITLQKIQKEFTNKRSFNTLVWSEEKNQYKPYDYKSMPFCLVLVFISSHTWFLMRFLIRAR